MANNFTTKFYYNEVPYTAHISQVDASLYIFVSNPELHHLLPDGKAVYHSEKGLELSHPQMTEYQNLMAAILTSIETNGALKEDNISPNIEKKTG